LWPSGLGGRVPARSVGAAASLPRTASGIFVARVRRISAVASSVRQARAPGRNSREQPVLSLGVLAEPRESDSRARSICPIRQRAAGGRNTRRDRGNPRAVDASVPLHSRTGRNGRGTAACWSPDPPGRFGRARPRSRVRWRKFADPRSAFRPPAWHSPAPSGPQIHSGSCKSDSCSWTHPTVARTLCRPTVPSRPGVRIPRPGQ